MRQTERSSRPGPKTPIPPRPSSSANRTVVTSWEPSTSSTPSTLRRWPRYSGQRNRRHRALPQNGSQPTPDRHIPRHRPRRHCLSLRLTSTTWWAHPPAEAFAEIPDWTVPCIVRQCTCLSAASGLGPRPSALSSSLSHSAHARVPRRPTTTTTSTTLPGTTKDISKTASTLMSPAEVSSIVGRPSARPQPSSTRR